MKSYLARSEELLIKFTHDTHILSGFGLTHVCLCPTYANAISTIYTCRSRDGADVNKLERARAEVAQQRPAPASTPARQERRLLRRNSSATRPRRPPDTLHPRHLGARSRAHEDTPRPPPRSRAPDTVAASARRLARRGEQLRAELGSAGGEGEAKLDPHDTSDSGIVTDDSEAREATTSTSHYEVPWLAPRQGEELARVTEAISGLQRLDTVNTRLETSGEQILALGLEHRLVAGAADCVEAARDTGLVLDTFAAEVARLRALNTGLLGEITTNRDTMQRLAASTARGGRQLRQLETEVSCAEAEAAQLEASLAQLQLVRLPPPLQLHCDNSDDVTNNVTNTSPQHVILSPSTLV